MGALGVGVGMGVSVAGTLVAAALGVEEGIKIAVGGTGVDGADVRVGEARVGAAVGSAGVIAGLTPPQPTITVKTIISVVAAL
jgi:hypothetical protein